MTNRTRILGASSSSDVQNVLSTFVSSHVSASVGVIFSTFNFDSLLSCFLFTCPFQCNNFSSMFSVCSIFIISLNYQLSVYSPHFYFKLHFGGWIVSIFRWKASSIEDYRQSYPLYRDTISNTRHVKSTTNKLLPAQSFLVSSTMETHDLIYIPPKTDLMFGSWFSSSTRGTALLVP